MSTQRFRHETSGDWIDRSRPIRFRFNNQELTGYAGDTLASALLAKPSGTRASAENHIALAVFVVSVVVSLGMLARIAFHSRKVRTHQRP